MKTIETASDGTQVKTFSVYLQEADCFILVQEIIDMKGRVEVRNTITLSRADIKALSDTERTTPAHHQPTATDEDEEIEK